MSEITPNSNEIIKDTMRKKYIHEAGLKNELVLLRDNGRLEKIRKDHKYESV